MLRRKTALRDPVTIFLDGEAVPAERGEPLAVALLASDIVTLARSPKLHRPRGPSCLRGGCDGCLARVDGEPNVMTCLRRARGGERIETQNVVGSRKADLLRVTDWFFPNGLDHHHFMAGVPGLRDVMQSFARKVAGLGRVPTEPLAPIPARRIDADAAVVGAGPAGIAVASRLRAGGLRVCLIDDGITPAGSFSAAPERAAAILERCPLDGVEVLTESVAAGVYLGEILIAPELGASGASDGRTEVAGGGSEPRAFLGATVLRARAKIFATGAHDGVLAAPNNDLPGIFSARTLCRLLASGVDVEGPIALAGSGFWADELAQALGDRVAARVQLGDVVRVEGSSRVRAVVVKNGTKTRAIKVDTLAVAAPCAPSFEVVEQAGAATRYVPGVGYAVVCDERGRAAEGVWAVGECTGRPLDGEAFAKDAETIAEDVLRSLA
jgi:sarcosine oxidase subunit alpha